VTFGMCDVGGGGQIERAREEMDRGGFGASPVHENIAGCLNSFFGDKLRLRVIHLPRGLRVKVSQSAPSILAAQFKALRMRPIDPAGDASATFPA
jgi:hypothetical protein